MPDILWQFPYSARPLNKLLQNDVIMTFLPSVKRMNLFHPIHALTLIHWRKYIDTDWCSYICCFLCINSFHGHGRNQKVWHPRNMVSRGFAVRRFRCKRGFAVAYYFRGFAVVCLFFTYLLKLKMCYNAVYIAYLPLFGIKMFRI